MAKFGLSLLVSDWFNFIVINHINTLNEHNEVIISLDGVKALNKIHHIFIKK